MLRILLCLISMCSVAMMLTAACATSGPKTVAVNGEDAGRTIFLNRGDIVEATLIGNPSTGYMWETQELDRSVLVQTGETEFKPDRSEPGFVGSPGKMFFRFEAAGSGSADLKLVYRRSWEKEVPPAETFEVKVIVR